MRKKEHFENTDHLTVEEIRRLHHTHKSELKTGIEVLIDLGIQVSSTPIIYLKDAEKVIDAAMSLPLPDDLKRTIAKMAL